MEQAIQSQFPNTLSYQVFYDEPEQCPPVSLFDCSKPHWGRMVSGQQVSQTSCYLLYLPSLFPSLRRPLP